MKSHAVKQEQIQEMVKLAVSGFVWKDEQGKTHKFFRNDELALMLRVQYNSAMRVSDVLSLKLSEIVEYAPGCYRWNKIEKKTKKLRDFDINNRLVEDLKNYATKNNIAVDEAIFKVGTRAYNKNIKIISNYMGIKEGTSSHMIRKSRIRNTYDTTKDISLCKEMCLHSDVKYTMIYIDTKKNEVNNVFTNNAI